MRRNAGSIVAVAALAVAAGCATASRQAAATQGEYPTAEIAALEHAIERETELGALRKLLLARGHAYLVEGENWLKAHPDPQERRRNFDRYGGNFLKAVNDFETIIVDHADSPEAPEAMYHLGIVYDYPNISNFSLAIHYYRRTVERYPDTEWAGHARQAIDNIKDLFHRMRTGTHGI